MSDSERNEMTQQRLALRHMAGLLRVQSGAVLVLAAFGIYQLHIRHFALAACAVLGAAILGLIVFSLLKQRRMIRTGTAVYAALPRSDFQMPQVVSIAVVTVLIVFVGVCSAFILYVVSSYFKTQAGWTVCGVTLLAIWLFIAYCWYRIFTEKPPAKPMPLREQTEGVWPPAPLAADVTRSED